MFQADLKQANCFQTYMLMDWYFTLFNQNNPTGLPTSCDNRLINLIYHIAQSVIQKMNLFYGSMALHLWCEYHEHTDAYFILS